MKHHSFFHLPAALVALGISTSPLLADDPPRLQKEDARKILLAMDYDLVNVVAIIQGVHEKGVGSPSVCTVIAMTKRDGKYADVRQPLYYDAELGWFWFESSPKMIRIWNRAGYREVESASG